MSVIHDVAIIGAGIAGLTVAQQLHQAGYQVVVVEKSRGVGGRVATRRLYETVADHGACYLHEGELLQRLITMLVNKDILRVWTDIVYHLTPNSTLQSGKQYRRYVAPMGMSTIAKFLATGLDIRLNQRVQRIANHEQNTWLLTLEGTENLMAKAIVVAIPAPQAWSLLETTLTTNCLNTLSSVKFAPCISIMAGYSRSKMPELPVWKACNLEASDLAWIGLDSSKRLNPSQPVFVLQSSAAFAEKHLDTEDLQPVATELLSTAGKLLISWLDSPEWMQIHRWRYAFPTQSLNQDCFIADTTLPLICCGDWCGGDLIAGAINSGMAAAMEINQKMAAKTLPNADFLDALS